jgi:NAD(P)H dehydrogenase (quinone)
MKILVIYAHPNPKSLNHAIKESFLEGAKEAGHITHVIDLYKENFDPVLRTPEKHGEESELVRKHQDLIRWADWMVFVYPVWWLRAPAILEGWFDKILSAGFAFKYKRVLGHFGVPVGLLPCTKAVVLETYGGPAIGIVGMYRNVGWRRIKNNVLAMCGVKTIQHLPFYSAPSASEEKRKQWLEKVKKAASSLR